jgi:hypothetical protein
MCCAFGTPFFLDRTQLRKPLVRGRRQSERADALGDEIDRERELVVLAPDAASRWFDNRGPGWTSSTCSPRGSPWPRSRARRRINAASSSTAVRLGAREARVGSVAGTEAAAPAHKRAARVPTCMVQKQARCRRIGRLQSAKFGPRRAIFAWQGKCSDGALEGHPIGIRVQFSAAPPVRPVCSVSGVPPALRDAGFRQARIAAAGA